MKDAALLHSRKGNSRLQAIAKKCREYQAIAVKRGMRSGKYRVAFLATTYLVAHNGSGLIRLISPLFMNHGSQLKSDKNCVIIS